MERTIAAFGRGLLCAMTLAGLAACNSDGSATDTTDPPPVSGNPTQPEPTPNEPANVAPQIAGNPGNEVLVGSAYSFTPEASDEDGDGLSFSIDGKPSWATFDQSTGTLAGTPDATDVGSYEGIVIRVTDGTSWRAMAAFSIDVVQQSNGSISLAWQAPTLNTDGSPLTNLEGFRIHYGTQSGSYDQTIDIDNPGLTRFVVENLSPGTYYIAISAISANGAESDLSREASKTI